MPEHLPREEIEQIAEAVSKHLEAGRQIDVATHKKHHDFIDTLIAKEARREERREKLVQAVTIWGALLTLTAIGTAFWQYVKDNLE